MSCSHHLTAFVHTCTLPLPARQTPTCSASHPVSKPKTVGIAGAGIAGLTAALALLKTPSTGVQQVTIYEPRDSLDFGIGAALNLSGGAAILSKIYDIDLYPLSRPVSYVRGRQTSGSTLYEVDVRKQIMQNEKARQWLMKNDRPLFVTIMRDTLQQVLHTALQNSSVTILRGPEYAVQDVKRFHDKVKFILANGQETPSFDLVIGADGVRSRVRHYVTPLSNPSTYSGFRVQWAIASAGQCSLPNELIQQWFGDGGYSLHYAAGAGKDVREMIAVAFRENKPARENANYENQDIRADCERRLQSMGMPTEVTDVLERADQFIETGVYYHAQTLTWSRGGNCVLIGDSAHAMPPFLGQGANQAIQDAYALAQALSKIGTDPNIPSLAEALKQFESVRRPPASAILESSRLIGLLETQRGPIGMVARDIIFRLAGLTGATGQALIQSAVPRV